MTVLVSWTSTKTLNIQYMYVVKRAWNLQKKNLTLFLTFQRSKKSRSRIVIRIFELFLTCTGQDISIKHYYSLLWFQQIKWIQEIPPDSQATRAFFYIKVLNYLIERVSDDDVCRWRWRAERAGSEKKGFKNFFYFPKALLIERNSLPSTMTMFFCIATTTEGKSRYMCDAGRWGREMMSTFLPLLVNSRLAFFKWFFFSQVAQSRALTSVHGVYRNYSIRCFRIEWIVEAKSSFFVC